MLDIFVDADACPVKQEVYKVARRLDLQVVLVSNSFMRTPPDVRVRLVQVDSGMDVADAWIAENITIGDICITADIPLAAKCLQAGACALGPRGKPFELESIGDALATRELMSTLRSAGMVGGGPAPISRKDRSCFLDQLDQMIQRIRAHPEPPFS